MNLGDYIAAPHPFNSGGMGDVYEATDKKLGRKACIKMIKKKYSDSPLWRKRFLREAILMSEVRHENIVQIYSYGINGDVWLAMEHIEGHPLDYHDLPLSIPDVLRFMSQIARALDVIHKKGIAHCDIKPGNVMKSGDRFVLIDFGLGFREDGDEDTARTSVRSTAGTPPYAPPEQSVGDPSFASDIYSLGCTAYELVTGFVPFRSKNKVKLANMHSQSPRPPAIIAAPNCPSWLSDVISQCMSIEANDRPLPFDIIQSLEARQTLEIDALRVFVDPSVQDMEAVDSLLSRFLFSHSKEKSDIIISADLEDLMKFKAKKIYVVDVDDSDEKLIKAESMRRSGVTTLIKPITPAELISAIET